MSATPPTAPAAPANPIPIGLGTKLGALGTMILGVAALVAAVLGGDHTAETIGALASAAIVLIATIAGRFAQAYAIYRTGQSPGAVDLDPGTAYPAVSPLDPPQRRA